MDWAPLKPAGMGGDPPPSFQKKCKLHCWKQRHELGVHYAYMHSGKPKNRGRRKKIDAFKKMLSGSQYPPEIKPLTLGNFTAPSP